MGLVTIRKARRLSAREQATVRERGDKARTSEQRRQWELAALSEPMFARAFMSLMRSLFTDEMEQSIRGALVVQNATVESVVAAILFFDEDAPDTFAVWTRFAGSLRNAYARAVQDSADAEAKRHGWDISVEVAKIDGPKEVVGAALATVPISAVSLSYIRTQSLSRAVQLSDDMKDTIRAILGDAFEAGRHPNAIIAEIKGTIGLTRIQRGRAVAREGAMLEAGASSVAAAAARDQFAAQMRRQRAQAIARTETLDAQTQGLKEAWSVAGDEGLMPPGTTKRWIATFDERLSEICEELHNQEVPVGDTFDGPEGPLDGPPAHPNCRSTMTLVFP